MRTHDIATRIRALSEALAAHREAGDAAAECAALTKLGNLAINLADLPGALDYLHQADEISLRLEDADLQREVAGQLAFVHAELGDLDTALALTRRGYERDSRAADPEVRLLAINGLGCLLSASGEHDEGIARLNEADAVIAALPPGRRREHLLSQSNADLSDALLRAGKQREALERAERGAAHAEGIDHAPLVMLNRFYAGRAALALRDAPLAAERLESAAAMASSMGHKSQESQARISLADALESLGRHGEALAAYRSGHRLEREIRRDQAAQRIEFRRSQREIEAAHREKENADRVLFAVLPPAIARRMKQGEGRIADEVADVSIMFADLVGFTPLASRTGAAELLGMLDRIFTAFDGLVEAARLEKIKTIGDAYMVVGGALDASPDHLERCARVAREMLAAVERIAHEGGPRLAIRIGLHTGPAIAGVIGKQRLSFDLWGETVNFASRLESSGTPGRVHVSGEVARRLAHAFAFEPRGAVAIKGIGEVETFFLAPA